jgi:hypothetical protein
MLAADVSPVCYPMRPTATIRTGVAGHGHKHWGSDYTHRAIFVRLLALCMMAAAIGMAVYSAIHFKLRGEMLL